MFFNYFWEVITNKLRENFIKYNFITNESVTNLAYLGTGKYYLYEFDKQFL